MNYIIGASLAIIGTILMIVNGIDFLVFVGIITYVNGTILLNNK